MLGDSNILWKPQEFNMPQKGDSLSLKSIGATYYSTPLISQ